MTTTTDSPPQGRKRGFETVRDMVLSMAVVGAVVATTFWVVAWQRPEVQGPIRAAVDVEQVVAQVQDGGAFDVLRPGLPDGWTPTSAWFDPASVSDVDGGVLHIGYVTPGGSYAEVRQTDAEADVVVDEWVDGAEAVGSVTIEGATWDRVESDASGQQGLVLVRENLNPVVTVVVTGKADGAELEALASALR